MAERRQAEVEWGRDRRMRPLYRVSRSLAQLLFMSLFRGRVFGVHNVPARGGVILAANHQSFLDPILATLSIGRECSYMARDTLFEHPVLRAVIEYYNAFPIRRDTADLRGLKELIRRLRQGRVVLTFPEGTRSEDGSIGPMRAGVALAARRLDVPVVPTLILGALQVWPRSRRWPRPHPVLVSYAKPVYPDEHEELTDERYMELVRERILVMLARYEHHSLFAS
jgi:1-acyl-sn-glycerol-3-phosphate acyltransferase